ncbi:MAG: lipid IV(A) 3-deoxy-D-manno-octulosonic acid transferase [Gammaproteobacteria bacterium]|nr:lipid IV(A) 3-deoxy-D-manno-octulosonic acid transferase [Gammaproteobacteria bacterium]MBQ0841187.1 lipid IV(A) 3-deoxy-D-manno-octulosonic acid transferase [Gammaproteobacteria bacterium]
MARLLYTLLIYLCLPLILLRLLWRGSRAPAYRHRWGERFGFVGRLADSRPVIWVHAVSVGETIAAAAMVRRLQKQHPESTLLVTTMTPTGSAQVAKIFGDSVAHCYAPYDMPDAIARFLSRTHPTLLVIMETELWPNLIHACHQRAIPVVLANARLSAKSAAGYAKVARLATPMLRELSAIAAQTKEDGERFLQLGVARDALEVTGNIKFDLQLDVALRQRAALLKKQWRGSAGRPVWLAASTHRGEDAIIIDAFKQVLEHRSDVLLVLVPRHPERFSEVAALCSAAGYRVQRRSEVQASETAAVESGVQIVLGDTMGELLSFCGASDITFVGGSLVDVGGHNLIEPAAWGVPVLSGPHLFNFTEVSRLLSEAGALDICVGASELAARVVALMADREAYQQMSSAALAVTEANRGALDRLTVLLEKQICQPPAPVSSRY